MFLIRSQKSSEDSYLNRKYFGGWGKGYIQLWLELILCLGLTLGSDQWSYKMPWNKSMFMNARQMPLLLYSFCLRMGSTRILVSKNSELTQNVYLHEKIYVKCRHINNFQCEDLKSVRNVLKVNFIFAVVNLWCPLVSLYFLNKNIKNTKVTNGFPL